MGIHHALYSGVTGLNSNSDGMSVIANNIANANTRAFKADRAEFEDLLAMSINEHSQIGRGARLRNIATDHSQGALTPTGGVTDLGIQGEGFFVLKNTGISDDQSEALQYTRQGSFSFNKDGYLTDTNGDKVMGYMADTNGQTGSRLEEIRVLTSAIPPKPTDRVTLALNLDSRSHAIDKPFDVTKPLVTSNYSTTVPIYDSIGTLHQCTIYFRKLDAGPGENQWEWHATVAGNELEENPGVNDKGEQLSAEVASGKIEFDSEGKPVMKFRTQDGIPTFVDMQDHSDAYEVQFANGAKLQKVQFNFGPNEDEYGKVGTEMSSSQASNSSTYFHSQDGYDAGYLKSLRIDTDGSIRGVFTNGIDRRLANIAMATFTNQGALRKVGRNNYAAPPSAGAPRFGRPTTGTRGSVFSSSLEESNVDLAKEFVQMITTQRAFQANSKSITTSDSLLEEVINLKR